MYGLDGAGHAPSLYTKYYRTTVLGDMVDCTAEPLSAMITQTISSLVGRGCLSGKSRTIDIILIYFFAGATRGDRGPSFTAFGTVDWRRHDTPPCCGPPCTTTNQLSTRFACPLPNWSWGKFSTLM